MMNLALLDLLPETPESRGLRRTINIPDAPHGYLKKYSRLDKLDSKQAVQPGDQSGELRCGKKDVDR
jgi:hypothetical protein